MDRKHLLGGVAALALIMGGTMQAQADGMESAAPPGWTGGHIGVGGGINFLLSPGSTAYARDGDWTDPDDCCDGCDEKFMGAIADLGRAGGFGTIEGGFDVQRNRIVFGILANYDFGKKQAEFGSEVTNWEADSYVKFAVGGRLTMSNSWSVAARAGVLNNTQNTLWYGLLGYTQAKLKGEECYNLDDWWGRTDTCDGDNDGPFVVNKNKGGLTVGAGVESLLTNALSLKLEYRYTKLGSFNAERLGNVGYYDDGSDDYEGFSFDPVDHSVRGVLSWRFGHRGP
ncbi:MAG: outer membrane protein [Gammaproteobacteria bacterium]